MKSQKLQFKIAALWLSVFTYYILNIDVYNVLQSAGFP